MMRHGCSREATLAVAIASSWFAPVASMTRVMTRPRVITPPSLRVSTSRRLISTVVVAGMGMIMGVSRLCRHARAWHRRLQGPTYRIGTAQVGHAWPSEQ